MAEESNNAPEAAADGAQQAGPQFALQRIYLKDTSFESPKSPQIYQTQWSPKINFDIKTRNNKVADDVYEVVLVLTAEAQLEEETAFVVEVHQAGIFTVKEFSETDVEQVLATVCPSILFPYSRESLDALVVKGSFPPLMIAPINFEALYAQQKQAAEQQAAGGEAAPESVQ